jgi:hypothetical protein
VAPCPGGSCHARPHQDGRARAARAADAFDALIDERGWGQGPLLLRVEATLDPDAGAELEIKRLDVHPAQALLGFSAPLAWAAIGVSAEGWARPCTDTHHRYRLDVPTGSEESPKQVRSLVLLDRDGNAASRLRGEDGLVVTEAPEETLILDCLLRAMGPRTAPPAAATATLFNTI